MIDTFLKIITIILLLGIPSTTDNNGNACLQQYNTRAYTSEIFGNAGVITGSVIVVIIILLAAGVALIVIFWLL